VQWSREFVLALAWLRVVLSIGSIGLFVLADSAFGRDFVGEPVLIWCRR